GRGVGGTADAGLPGGRGGGAGHGRGRPGAAGAGDVALGCACAADGRGAVFGGRGCGMSTLSTAGPPPAQAGGAQRRGRIIGALALGRDGSRNARLLAAAVLEVLAGERMPAEAATALGLSLPRYYQVEQQALRGLTAACEPRPPGRQVRPDQEASNLRRENARLRRDVLRQQALVRAVQRSVGLAPPAAT